MAERRTTEALISSQRRDERVTKASTVVGQLKELFPLWLASTEKAARMDRWYYSELRTDELPILARNAPRGVKDLREASVTGWAKMICDGASQDLIVDSFRKGDNTIAAAAIRRWQQNGLDARQKSLHDGIIRHGKAFNLIGRAVGRLDGKPTAYIRGKSARVADAFFRDDFDEFPEIYLEGHLQKNDDGDEVYRFDLWDESAHHWLTCDRGGEKVEYIAYEEHHMGLCPVVRGTINLDLTGRAIGEIEPYINIFTRLNQGNMDRLVVQRYGAYAVRYIAGIAKPATDEEARAAAIALSATDLLMVENPQSKIGSLPPTPLDGYLRAGEADIRHLSATSQTPSFHMLGLSDNVGAEGLAAAEASHMRKMALAKTALGELHETSNRLAGYAAGDMETAQDYESKTHWVDTTSQSFQSLVQGLTGLAQGLEVPPEMLWERIPNWDAADTAQAKKLIEQIKAQEQLAAEEEQAKAIEMVRATADAKAKAAGGRPPAR